MSCYNKARIAAIFAQDCNQTGGHPYFWSVLAPIPADHTLRLILSHGAVPLFAVAAVLRAYFFLSQTMIHLGRCMVFECHHYECLLL